MKKFKLVVINLIAIFALSFISCGQVGPQGPKGEQGIQGPKGDKGEEGNAGEQGIKGEKGDVGDKGEKGDIGFHGLKGPIGDYAFSNIIIPSNGIVVIPDKGSYKTNEEVIFKVKVTDSSIVGYPGLLVDNELVELTPTNVVGEFIYKTIMKDNGFIVQGTFESISSALLRNKSISLTKNFRNSEEITIIGEKHIELNGFDLYSSKTITVKGNLTINNNNNNHKGHVSGEDQIPLFKIVSSNDESFADASSLILTGKLDIIVPDMNAAIILEGNHSLVTIGENVSVSPLAGYNSGQIPILMNGGYLVVNGSINTDVGPAIRLNKGNVSIKGYVGADNNKAIEVNGGELEINGGEVWARSTGEAIRINGGTTTIKDGQIVGQRECDGIKITNGTLNINGGLIKAESYNRSAILINQEASTEEINININGGKITNTRNVNGGASYPLITQNGSGDKVNLKINTDKVIFDDKEFDITATTNDPLKGNVVVNPAKAKIGDEVIFKFIAKPGYKLKALTLNGQNVLNKVMDNELKITMLVSNFNLVATFDSI